MLETDFGPDRPEGLRERKRRETHDRIAEVGLRLFIENGFEATTLDAIAAAAGISRRTFFYYFKSKEDVLLAHEGSGFAQALDDAMLGEEAEDPPIDVALRCFLKLAARYETKESILVDRLLRSTEALLARKEAKFIDMEQALADALAKLWPEPDRQEALRMVAMTAVGTLRLALADWRQEEANHPLTHYLQWKFSLLEGQFQGRR